MKVYIAAPLYCDYEKDYNLKIDTFLRENGFDTYLPQRDGGELAAMVLVDCVSRFIPGVLGSEESPEEESFSDGLLEYPQYTRPAVWEGVPVPEVLLSGHHARIQAWRREQSLRITQKNRPDLLKTAELTAKERKMLEETEPCS